MAEHVNKSRENKGASAANPILQKQKSESLHPFVDNRPEATLQRKLQDMASNSPQVLQLRSYQAMADSSADSKLQGVHQPGVHSYTPYTIQRQGRLDESPVRDPFKSQPTRPSIEPLVQRNPALQKKANNTGLPDNLKAGVENLSGFSMDDVKVYYNSGKPAQLQAHAYAQGTDIHIAPGQEKHLPHEAWHIAQQKDERVKPTLQLKGIAVNDNQGLEREADIMGTRALQMKNLSSTSRYKSNGLINQRVVQRQTVGFEVQSSNTHIYERTLGNSTDEATRLTQKNKNTKLWDLQDSNKFGTTKVPKPEITVVGDTPVVPKKWAFNPANTMMPSGDKVFLEHRRLNKTKNNEDLSLTMGFVAKTLTGRKVEEDPISKKARKSLKSKDIDKAPEKATDEADKVTYKRVDGSPTIWYQEEYFKVINDSTEMEIVTYPIDISENDIELVKMMTKVLVFIEKINKTPTTERKIDGEKKEIKLFPLKNGGFAGLKNGKVESHPQATFDVPLNKVPKILVVFAKSNWSEKREGDLKTNKKKKKNDPTLRMHTVETQKNITGMKPIPQYESIPPPKIAPKPKQDAPKGFVAKHILVKSKVIEAEQKAYGFLFLFTHCIKSIMKNAKTSSAKDMYTFLPRIELCVTYQELLEATDKSIIERVVTLKNAEVMFGTGNVRFSRDVRVFPNKDVGHNFDGWTLKSFYTCIITNKKKLGDCPSTPEN